MVDSDGKMLTEKDAKKAKKDAKKAKKDKKAQQPPSSSSTHQWPESPTRDPLTDSPMFRDEDDDDKWGDEKCKVLDSRMMRSEKC
jgi:hypothetical protein